MPPHADQLAEAKPGAQPDHKHRAPLTIGRLDQSIGFLIDGTRFWANVVITALRDKAAKLIGFAKVTRDLTDRKQAEEAQRAVAGERAILAEKARLQEFQERFILGMISAIRSPRSTWPRAFSERMAPRTDDAADPRPFRLAFVHRGFAAPQHLFARAEVFGLSVIEQVSWGLPLWALGLVACVLASRPPEVLGGVFVRAG